MSDVLEKHPDESTIYDFYFGKFQEVIAGDTVASVVSVTKESTAGSDTLIIGAPTFSANRVQFRLSSGEAGDSYVIEVIVTTAGGQTLVGCGKLKVKGCA